MIKTQKLFFSVQQMAVSACCTNFPFFLNIYSMKNQTINHTSLIMCVYIAVLDLFNKI